MKAINHILIIGLSAFSTAILSQSNTDNLQQFKIDNSEPEQFFFKTTEVKSNSGSFNSPAYDSVYSMEWDNRTKNWSTREKIVNMQYDPRNNLTFSSTEYWDGSLWVDKSQTICTYNLNNTMSSQTIKVWDGNRWVNSQLDFYSYDSNNNLTGETHQIWDAGQWVNSTKFQYIYDAHNRNISALYELWNGSGWANSQMHIYAYNANDDKTMALFQVWDAKWINVQRLTYVYDPSSEKVSTLIQDWNENTWQNVSKDTIRYDLAHHQISVLRQNWVTEKWQNVSMDIYNYESLKNRVTDVGKSWLGNWVSNYTDIYTYDNGNNIISVIYQDNKGASLVKSEIDVFTYNSSNILENERHQFYDSSGAKIISGNSSHYYIDDELSGYNYRRQNIATR